MLDGTPVALAREQIGLVTDPAIRAALEQLEAGPTLIGCANPRCDQEFAPVPRQKFCTAPCRIRHYAAEKLADDAARDAALQRRRDWGRRNREKINADARRRYHEDPVLARGKNRTKQQAWRASARSDVA